MKAKEYTLLVAVANVYYHTLNAKINNEPESRAIYNKCVNIIKLLTNMKKREVEELIVTTTICDNPIQTLFNRFKEWL